MAFSAVISVDTVCDLLRNTAERARSQHTKRLKERYIVTQQAKFRGNPLFRATKQHSKQQLNGEKCDVDLLLFELFCYVVLNFFFFSFFFFLYVFGSVLER